MVCTSCTCFTDVFALFLFRNISKVFCNLHSFKQICLVTPVVLFLLHVFLLQTLNCLVLLGTTHEEKKFFNHDGVYTTLTTTNVLLSSEALRNLREEEWLITTLYSHTLLLKNSNSFHSIPSLKVNNNSKQCS